MTTVLRELIAEKRTINATAAYDCLSAMIAEKVGFEAIKISGLSYVVAQTGLPDIGIETRTDMIEMARRVCDSVQIPVIIDASDGYGGPGGIYQTVHGLERAGAAGAIIEDQTFPAVCPMIGPPDVVPIELFVKKIKVALEARQDKDFVIIARTDAAARYGVDEAVKRVKAFHEAGADIVSSIAGMPREKESLRKFVQDTGNVPINVPSSHDLGVTLADYNEIGIRMIGGLEGLLSATKAIKAVYEELHSTGFVKDPDYHAQNKETFKNLSDLLGWDKWLELNAAF
jgi:2-methylisocitrate lyase-like PEP mutase family enzyme